MVLVRGASVERLGEMAALPPDQSPLQCGSRGVWNGTPFELIGRIRVEWTGGSWTEWWAEFADGQSGWIAETQGFFAVSFPRESREPLPAAEDLPAEGMVQLAGKFHTIIDVKSVTCLAGEGALPFAAPPGITRQSVDFMAEDGAFATLDYFPGSPPELFTGTYATFASLQFSNLRPVPGWDGEVAQTRHATTALNCPGCGAPVVLRASGLTMAAVCGSCGGVIDTANPNAQLIQEADKKVRAIRPLIEIGRRGQFFGAEYEVIGMLARFDGYSKWSEYLLFNPWQGFRWLVTYNGHWSFIERLLEIPKTGIRKASLRDGRKFGHFASANTQVVAVLGEFFWKVERGEKSELNDFIAPPFILSAERYPGLQEVTWSLGEYVDPASVASAFGLPKPTEPVGIYLNQPNPHFERWRSLRGLAAKLAITALLVQILFALWSGEHPVTNWRHVFQRPAPPEASAPSEASPLSDPARTIVTPEFQLTGRTQPVTVALQAPVQNNWLGVSYALVNADTNQTFPGALTAEYYSGMDGGEAWSDGADTASVKIPAVPPGRYFLRLDADADQNVAAMPFSVQVRRGGLFVSNFVFVLAIICAYPAWVFIRRLRFESSRWAQSDHAPSSD